DLNRQGNSFFKPSRLTDPIMEENSLHPSVPSMANRVSPRSYLQISHDSYQDGTSKSNEFTEEDDDHIITSSTVDPISIKFSNRYHQRNISNRDLSPNGSFSESLRESYVSEKGKYFFKQPVKSNTFRQNRHTLVNPCNPSKFQNHYGMSSHLRRWGHVFPR